MNGGFPTLRTLDWWLLSGFNKMIFGAFLVRCFPCSVRDYDVECGSKRLDFESLYYSGHRPLGP